MKTLFGIVACVAALTLSSQAATAHHKAAKKASDDYALVSEVKTVTLKPSMFGHTLTITALGIVPKGGWTSPELQPKVYVTPPADGIYTFEFRVKKPTAATDPVTDQMAHPITAKRTWWNPPAKLKGVRVVAKRNSIVERLQKSSKSKKAQHP